MDGSQARFDFMKTPDVPVLDADAQRQWLKDFFEKHGIKGLDLDHIKLRPRQFAVLQELLENNERTLWEAGTGSGKTVAFLVEAAAECARGNRAVLVTPMRHLTAQAKDIIEKLTTTDAFSVMVLTGAKAPAARARRYAEKADILIVTDGIFTNDFDSIFDWNGISLVVIDEPQKMHRNGGELPNAARLRLEKPDLRVRVMSATLAAGEGKLLQMQRSVGKSRFLHVPSAVELAAEAGEKIPEEEEVTIVDNLFEVPLDPQLRTLVQAIRMQAIRCENTIQRELGMNFLFELPENLELRIPGYYERDALWRRVEACRDEEKSYFLKSIAAELHKWCAGFNRAALMGRFAFLDWFFYRYAQRSIQSGLFLAELDERAKRKSDQGCLSLADKRILGNESVLEALAPVVAGTPYEVMLDFDNWDDIFLACQPMFKPLEKGSAETFSTRLRRREQAVRNKRLGCPGGRTEQARLFFDNALRFMARRELSDHNKIAGLLERLNEHAEILDHSRGYVFTSVVRHAEFLAELLDYRFDGARPISISGRTNDRVRTWGLDEFRKGNRNLLVSTVAFGGTGIDAPVARIAQFINLPDSRSDNLIQSRGRVIGRAAEEAYIDAFTTKGTYEAGRYNQAFEKGAEAKRAVTNRARAVLPTVRVEKAS